MLSTRQDNRYHLIDPHEMNTTKELGARSQQNNKDNITVNMMDVLLVIIYIIPYHMV